MPPVARPLNDVLNSLPAEWKVHFHYSYYLDEDKLKSGEFGETKRTFHHTKDDPIDAAFLNGELEEEFRHNQDLSRIKLEFAIKTDGVFERKTSVNVSRDTIEAKNEAPKINQASPNAIILAYIELCNSLKAQGKQIPEFEDFVKLYNHSLNLLNQGKAEPVSGSLLRMAMDERHKALAYVQKREENLDKREDSLFSKFESIIAHLARREEAAQNRADSLAAKLQSNAVAESIKAAGETLASVAEKLANANPESALGRTASVALVALTEKNPEVVAKTTRDIVGVKND